VIRAYQQTVAREIARFEGYVAKFMGDGVLAYFGFPRAHEDEAERAARSALALVDAVGRLGAPDGTALAARVGIATGPVVVGELIGEGAVQEEAVIGATPNLAARLQALAEPGQVVIASDTPPARGPVRAGRSGPSDTEGLRSAGPGLARPGRERCREPL
jgi:class 3 adenylate cyclase